MKGPEQSGCKPGRQPTGSAFQVCNSAALSLAWCKAGYLLLPCLMHCKLTTGNTAALPDAACRRCTGSYMAPTAGVRPFMPDAV